MGIFVSSTALTAYTTNYGNPAFLILARLLAQNDHIIKEDPIPLLLGPSGRMSKSRIPTVGIQITMIPYVTKTRTSFSGQAISQHVFSLPIKTARFNIRNGSCLLFN